MGLCCGLAAWKPVLKVDFASAFDSVDRDSLWRIMAADGMPPETLEADQGVLCVDQDEG